MGRKLKSNVRTNDNDDDDDEIQQQM